MTHDDDLMVAVFEPDRWALTADPAATAQVVAAVRRRRRRRTAARLGATVAAGAVLVAGVTVLPDLTENGPRLARPGLVMGTPQRSGPFPEVRHFVIADPTELPRILPGATVTELAASLADEVTGMTPDGELILEDADGFVALYDPDADRTRRLVPTELNDVTEAVADATTIAWVESTGTLEPDSAIVRCFDTRSGQVHRLDLPARNSINARYSPEIFQIDVWSGRIVVPRETEFSSESQPLAQHDLYVAERCGAPVELLAANAGNASGAGDWLYYSDARGTWRRDTVHGTPQQISDTSVSHQVTGTTVVTQEVLSPTSVSEQLNVARLDGSSATQVRTGSSNWWLSRSRSGSVPGEAVFGGIDAAAENMSIWLFFPDRGGLVSIQPPDNGRSYQYLIRAANGRYLLIGEFGQQGGDLDALLVTLP